VYNIDPSIVREYMMVMLKHTNRLMNYGPWNNMFPMPIHVNPGSSSAITICTVFRGIMDGDIPASTAFCEWLRAWFASTEGGEWLSLFEMSYWNGRIVESYAMTTCERCEEPVHEASTTTVYTSLGCSLTWCEDCRRNHATRCDVSRYYFVTNNFRWEETVNGLWFCYDFCVEERELVEEQENDDFGTVYDVVDRQSTRLPSYHNASRPWAARAIAPGSIGVELEIGFKNGEDDQREFLKRFMTAGGRLKHGAVELPFCVERDSSLNAVPGGMEIISDPLPLQEGYVAHDAPWRFLLNELVAMNAEGWKHRMFAGIHVNMDTKHVTSEDALKYALFISNCAALSKFVSGRKVIYGSGTSSPDALMQSMYSGGYQKKTFLAYGKLSVGRAISRLASENGKYTPVYFRGNNCIETRIFGSNIKYEGFMACVEYCTSVMDYVVSLSTTDMFSPTLSSEYRHWVSERLAKYPYIGARLGLTAHAKGHQAFTHRISPILEAA
jgi:hypothetical protein